ncbi:MAG: I78 family peptidase inhibitor [Sulfitobacter sp.]
MKTIFGLVGAVMLAGCGAVTTGGGGNGVAASAGGPDTCNAAAYASLVGQDAVTALQIPDPKRSYRPDEAITQDFNAARVNIVLDETDVISAITCG